MERVILVKGDQSNWYEQAIFIVRQNMPGNKLPVDFVKEAESIIERYMMKTGLRETASVPAREASALSFGPAKPEGIGARRKTSGKPPGKPRTVVARRRSNFDIFLNAVMLAGCIMLAVALAYRWFL